MDSILFCHSVKLILRILVVILCSGIQAVNAENAEYRAAIQQSKHHYNAVIQHLEKADSNSFDYGKRWGAFVHYIKNAIPNLHTAEEAFEFAQKKIKYTHRAGDEWKTICWLYEAQLISEFPEFEKNISTLNDTTVFGVDTLCRIHGSKTLKSNIAYYYLHTLFSCLSHVKAPRRIAEIGPGFGELARFWMMNDAHKPEQYILIDAPESLFFADTFLSVHFGPKSIYYMVSPEVDIDELKKYQFILCPVQFAEKIQKMPIDLVINTGSMQEMSKYWLNFWMRWLDDSDVKFFYSLNYFFQNIHLNDMLEEGNFMFPILSPRWVHRVQRFNPYWLRLQTTRSYGQILAEKLPKPIIPTPQAILYGKELLETREMDGDVFMEVMDLYRRSGDSALGYTLLNKAIQDKKNTPKEVGYLIERLISSTPLTEEKKRNELEKVQWEIAEILRVKESKVVW